MKKFLCLCLTSICLTSMVYAQKVGMTGVEAGFGSFSSPDFNLTWNTPSSSLSFHQLGAFRRWHNETHRVSISKEIGINLQFIDVFLSGGGLGAGYSFDGKIDNLFVNPSLMAHFQISHSFSADIGPTADILIIGRADIKNSYYSSLPNSGRNGEYRDKGLSRDYFSKPYLGLKMRINQLLKNNKTNLGFRLSYLWTQSDPSNFELPHEVQFCFYASFWRKAKD